LQFARSERPDGHSAAVTGRSAAQS
jgi:hypothetical protein